MYSIEDLLQLLLSERGEAVHFHPGETPVIEVSGVLHRLEGARLADGESDLLLKGIASE